MNDKIPDIVLSFLILTVFLFCFLLPLYVFVLLQIIVSSNKNCAVCGMELRL